MSIIENYVDAAADAIGLDIAPEHRAGVLANFARIAQFAQLITEFPLDEHAELAPVFKP